MSYTPGDVSVVGVGDYVQYQATSALDGTTGSVDWTTPLASSAGTSIVLDDSTGWVSDWGYAVPVLAAGTYTIAAKMRVTGATTDNTFTLGLMDASGSDIPPWGGDVMPNAASLGDASAIWTGRVPDGAHIDFAIEPQIGTGGTLNALTVTVERIA